MISFPFFVQNRPEKITSGSLSLLRVTDAWVACVKPVGAESEKEMPLLLRERLGGDVFPVHAAHLQKTDPVLSQGVGLSRTFHSTDELMEDLLRDA